MTTTKQLKDSEILLLAIEESSAWSMSQYTGRAEVTKS